MGEATASLKVCSGASTEVQVDTSFGPTSGRVGFDRTITRPQFVLSDPHTLKNAEFDARVSG
jgi:hypothetical protein